MPTIAARESPHSGVDLDPTELPEPIRRVRGMRHQRADSRTFHRGQRQDGRKEIIADLNADLL